MIQNSEILLPCMFTNDNIDELRIGRQIGRGDAFSQCATTDSGPTRSTAETPERTGPSLARRRICHCVRGDLDAARAIRSSVTKAKQTTQPSARRCRRASVPCPTPLCLGSRTLLTLSAQHEIGDTARRELGGSGRGQPEWRLTDSRTGVFGAFDPGRGYQDVSWGCVLPTLCTTPDVTRWTSIVQHRIRYARTRGSI